jgi:uncharacterized protein (TIGR03435 family)
MKVITLVLGMVVVGVAGVAAAQAPAPKFEVVSVKPASADAQAMRFGSSGGRFYASNVPLRTLMQNAYRPADGSLLLNYRIIGAPGWIDTDRYDIDATAPSAQLGPIPQQKLQPMLRGLLEDRFQLKTHYETRELPVYELVAAKGKQP